MWACDQVDLQKQAELPNPQVVAFTELPQSTASTYFLIGKFNDYETNFAPCDFERCGCSGSVDTIKYIAV
ncbi:MAG: hypothetical protein R3C26_14125 [Calditrichia bacterium]